MYRRSAGSGTPAKVRGRISEAYRDEKSERVRKSSEGSDGAVKLEKAFAAERMAWKDAVRLDLKDDFEVDLVAVERGVEGGRTATGVVGVEDRSSGGSSRSGCW
jgi:hypothetical protein